MNKNNSKAKTYDSSAMQAMLDSDDELPGKFLQ